ncbi:hypothetical protein I79_026080 [Cricetulus griseus]|uniref:Uncharacterized protein n=1 Tax=Cricetulus griseus TaxID=10029 RepID=G3IPZ6_CRIGR|nr:hypothetical protein I79_026080 [Cricetulus griseus]
MLFKYSEIAQDSCSCVRYTEYNCTNEQCRTCLCINSVAQLLTSVFTNACF